MTVALTAADASLLIVDDNTSKRTAIRAILEPLGHTIFEAGSGLDALRCVLKHDFAAVLMDIRMPIMDGYETAKLIGERHRSEATPIIFFTAYQRSEVETAAGYASGAVDFIFLPFDPIVVRAKVSVFVDLFLKKLELERSVSEITALLRAFRDSEIRIQTILDNVADGVITLGADGLIETINRAASLLLGYREEEVVGKPFGLLVAQLPLGDVPELAPAGVLGSGPEILPVGPTETLGTRKDGSTFPMEIEFKDVELGVRMVRVGCIRDMSERKASIRALEQQALHDSLTGLPNRRLFGDRLTHAVAAALRTKTGFAVFVLDLDGFKAVNDTLGHDRGDGLLCAVGLRLKAALRDSDTVARLGGDEFGILPSGPVDLTAAEQLAWKIQQTLEPAFLVDGYPVDLRASVGISLFPDNGSGSADLLRRADLAMYEAKRNSSGFAVYTAAGEEQTAANLARLGELRHCIERHELTLHYQPKIDLLTGRISGVEALLRWNHPREGLLYPDQFIAHVERSELIRPVTLWVLDEALHQQRLWRDAGWDLTMAVNISGRSLNSGSELPDTVAELTAWWRTPRDRLVLELTESSLIDAAVPVVLERLHGMGLRLSIDDFGTGYSSLAYLQRLPVDEIKIDKSFVLGLAANAADAVIVRSTIDLAHNLGLTVVAEGVEDGCALEMLRQYGSDAAQGYHFSRPVRADVLESWLRTSPFGVSATTPPIAVGGAP